MVENGTGRAIIADVALPERAIGQINQRLKRRNTHDGCRDRPMLLGYPGGGERLPGSGRERGDQAPDGSRAAAPPPPPS